MNKSAWAAMLWCFGPAAWLRADDAVKPVASSLAEFCAGCPSAAVRFGVSVPDKFTVAAGVEPKVLEASFGNRRDETLAKSIQARWDLDGSRPRAIVIGIDPPIKRVGTYNIVLDVGARMAPLTLQIEHAAAKLVTPEKLVIERTVYWPFAESVHGMDLILGESSRRSDVSDITMETRNVMHGKEEAAVELEFPAIEGGKTFTIPPGGRQPVEYALKGAFPLDTVTGTVQVAAPQLTDPVSFPFELRSRLPAFYMIPFILTGLALSWYMKVYQASKEQLEEARVAADRMLAKVRNDWDKYADGDFRGSLQVPVKDLSDARDARDPKAIEDARKRLDDAWVAALKNFGERREAVGKQLDEFRNVAEHPVDLPASIRARLTQAVGEAPSIRAILDSGDCKGAQGKLEEALRNTYRDLQLLAAAWQLKIREFVDILASARTGLPATVIAQFAENAKGFATGDPKTPTPSGLLDEIAGERRKALELLTSLKIRLFSEWQLVEKALDLTTKLPKKELFDALKNSLTAFAQKMQQAPDDPDRAVSSVATDLPAVQQQWRDTIRQQLPAVNAEVEKAIDELNFVAAVEKMAMVLEQAREHLGNVAATAANLDWPEVTLGSPSAGNAGPGTPAGQIATPEMYEQLAMAGQKEIERAKAMRTLVAGLLITIWAFGSYSTDFVGTLPELLKIFFAAFSLDVTIDALMGKTKSAA